jgi:hypothetical protein
MRSAGSTGSCRSAAFSVGAHAPAPSRSAPPVERADRSSATSGERTLDGPSGRVLRGCRLGGRGGRERRDRRERVG